MTTARWKGGWGRGEKGEGIKKYKLVVIHGDVKYKIGNMVSIIVITMHSVRQVLIFWHDQFISCINV